MKKRQVIGIISLLKLFVYRKGDSHLLKRMQREEMKETTEFYNRIKVEREAQEKKVEGERQEVERRFEAVSDAMVKKHKKEVEKLEQLQLQQFKSKAKSLKSEQVCFYVRIVCINREYMSVYIFRGGGGWGRIGTKQGGMLKVVQGWQIQPI